jgi:hypothetical protein
VSDDDGGIGTDTLQVSVGGTPPAPDIDIVINEFVANHVGADTMEFIEVKGTPNTDYSALSVLQIDGDGTNDGTILSIHPVGFVGSTGYKNITGFMPDVLRNGNITLVLVENFRGNLFDDVDPDNVGSITNQPWDRTIDDVAVEDPDRPGTFYSLVVLLATNRDQYDGASRIPDGFDTESAGDWVRNDFDKIGYPGFPGTPSKDEAYNTPGEPNQLSPLRSATPADELADVAMAELDLDDLLEFPMP